METKTTPFGKRIEERLKSLKLKQSDLADLLGIHTNMITYWKQGKEPGLYKAYQMSLILKCELEWLIEGDKIIHTKSDFRQEINIRRKSEKDLLNNFVQCFKNMVDTYPYIIEKIRKLENEKSDDSSEESVKLD